MMFLVYLKKCLQKIKIIDYLGIIISFFLLNIYKYYNDNSDQVFHLR